MKRNPPLRIAIAGLGTVGASVVSLIQSHADLLAQRAQRAIEIVAVGARSKSKQRGVCLDAYDWEQDPTALASRSDIDLFIELIGGSEGTAKAATEAALKSGKSVVTANKALLAMHGPMLAKLAEDSGQMIGFEAAVGGGIPAVKALRDGLAGDRILRVVGVLNGTCNYILTRMEKKALTYAQAFDEAQGLGYLEADPALDVGGIDTAHKLALLAAGAFGAEIDFSAIECQGIEALTYEDIIHTGKFGFRIKLLGLAQIEENTLRLRVAPCLVAAQSQFGRLENAENLIVFESEYAGRIALQGAGAGGRETASAVLSDVVDIARGRKSALLGVDSQSLKRFPIAATGGRQIYYIRMMLVDQPGALAQATAILAKYSISVDRVRQTTIRADSAYIAIITHETDAATLARAKKDLEGLGSVNGPILALAIEQ